MSRPRSSTSWPTRRPGRTIPTATCSRIPWGSGTRVAQASESWSYTTTPGSAGRLLTHHDFNGNLTSYVYYQATSGSGAAGELQAIVLPGTGSLQPTGTAWFTYDGFGRVKTFTDPSPFHRTVTYTYDPMGRVTSKLYPDGSTEQAAYATSAGSAAVLLSTTDRNGNQEHVFLATRPDGWWG